MTQRGVMMARTVAIPSEFGQHDFAALARQELNGRVYMRLLALAHLQEGKSPRQIGAMLKVHEKTVLVWLRRFRVGGLAGLAEQPGRGAKRRLPKQREGELKALIEQAHAQRPGGSLIGEDIQALIAEHFGVKYSLSAVYDVLHRAGLSWVSARSKHPQRDAQAQERFKKTSPLG